MFLIEELNFTQEEFGLGKTWSKKHSFYTPDNRKHHHRPESKNKDPEPVLGLVVSHGVCPPNAATECSLQRESGELSQTGPSSA